MFDTILVAVDQSDAARAACDLAIEVAKTQNAKLILLTVLDISKMVAVAGYESPYPMDAVSMLKEANEELLASTKALCAQLGVIAQTVTAEGDACDEILRVAQSERVNLICIGTHGRQGLSRLIIGSVAEGVLRRSTVPVLVTRPNVLAHAEPQAVKASG